MSSLCVSAAKNEESFDAIVAGGGPTGFAAAVSISRVGVKTLLIGGSRCLGGTSTVGALPFWLGAMTGSITLHKMVYKVWQKRFRRGFV